VSWKHKIQILDFETADRLEARCCSCGYTWYEVFVNEFEARMRCKQWNCTGKIVLSQTHNDETEGFQGGLA